VEIKTAEGTNCQCSAEDFKFFWIIGVGLTVVFLISNGGTIWPLVRFERDLGKTLMKFLTEYLERALSFERMAVEENNREVRSQFKKLAMTYRELAANRAARYGLSAPSPAPAPDVPIGGLSDRD
jgi:hypothetical protein